MKIFLVGATGRSGKFILESALKRGHQVTALVRESADRLDVSSPRLRPLVGDLLQLQNLPALLAGHDAVVSALNSSAAADGTHALIAAALKAQVTRFIGIAGGGILQLDESSLRRDRPGYPEAFRRSSEQHMTAWSELKASGLDWTLVCTPDLIPGPATNQLLHKVEYMPEGSRRVSIGDVAEFIVSALENGTFLKTRVGCTSPS